MDKLVRKRMVKIGYYMYVYPDSVSTRELAGMLASLIPIEDKDYDGKKVYTPKSEGPTLTFGNIELSNIRKPTKEEVENEELRSAKSMEKYYREKTEQLECDIKLLKREQEGERS